MKKITVFIFVLAFSITSFSQTKLGAQLVYGTTTEFGLGAKANFDISGTAISVAPSFNYFFGESAGAASTSVFTINADAHYNVASGEGLTLYPLAGLNLTNQSVTVLNNSASATKIGFNVGGGLQYGISSALTGFFEAKYVIGTFDQAVFSAGVLFDL